MDLVARNGSHALAEGPAPASTSGGVIEALDAADVERGLSRGGPGNSAVGAAARQDGPVRGDSVRGKRCQGGSSRKIGCRRPPLNLQHHFTRKRGPMTFFEAHPKK